MAVSALNLNPINQGRDRYNSQQQTGPYRGGLQSDFNFGQRSFTFAPGNPMPNGVKYSDPSAYGYATGGFSDADADVRGAANAAAEIQMPNAGTNSAEQQALLNMYKGRIATKNTLAEQIAGADKNLRDQEDIITGQAGQSLNQGLRNTRQNYNSRGLLYSGLRQGGEQQVKQGVASSLDTSISGAKRESANAKSAAQNAYASVDLANAQESLNLAHEAFDTASRNNIARLQAMQQLGQGVGALAGAYFGSRTPSTENPASSLQSANLTMPELGSQYGGTSQFNLGGGR